MALTGSRASPALRGRPLSKGQAEQGKKSFDKMGVPEVSMVSGLRGSVLVCLLWGSPPGSLSI